MPDKLTDKEIVKALEDTLHRIKGVEHLIVPKEGIENLCNGLQNALDLINRLQERVDDLERNDLPRCKDALRRANEMGIELQAENERLKGHQKDGFFNLLGNCLVFSKTLKDYNDMRKGLKAEAYKKFAELLRLGIVNKPSEFKASQATVDFLNGSAHRQQEILDEIELTLKELVGD